MTLYQYPPQTALKRVIPKTRIYDGAAASTALRDRFVREVDQITWAHKLAPETLNLPATPAVPEIQVFRVTLKGEPDKLTAQEYKLLSYLMHHKGKVVSRTELIEHIYDQDFDRDSNTIEVFVTRIRKKLGAEVITTIRGLGYSLDDPADAPRA